MPAGGSWCDRGVQISSFVLSLLLCPALILWGCCAGQRSPGDPWFPGYFQELCVAVGAGGGCPSQAHQQGGHSSAQAVQQMGLGDLFHISSLGCSVFTHQGIFDVAGEPLGAVPAW